MASGTTLTVSPGVIVKMQGSDIVINGTLLAQGTASDKVVFTSWRDDRYGGDFNGDGYASQPANGDWGYLYFPDASADDSVIGHAIINYGGSSGSGSVYAYFSSLTVRDSEIAHSSIHGMRVYNGGAVLENLEVYANSNDGLRLESGGSSSVTGSRFYGNLGDGVEALNSVTLTATGNEFFANVGYGLRNSSNVAVDMPTTAGGVRSMVRVVTGVDRATRSVRR
jgi:hypothetical protein